MARRNRGDHQIESSPSSSNVVVLKLNNSVRRVAIIHNCDEPSSHSPDSANATTSCIYIEKSRKFKHSATILDGGCYFLLNRNDGYPEHTT